MISSEIKPNILCLPKERVQHSSQRGQIGGSSSGSSGPLPIHISPASAPVIRKSAQGSHLTPSRRQAASNAWAEPWQSTACSDLSHSALNHFLFHTTFGLGIAFNLHWYICYNSACKCSVFNALNQGFCRQIYRSWRDHWQKCSLVLELEQIPKIHQLRIAQEEKESILSQQIVELHFLAGVPAALSLQHNNFLLKEKNSFEIKSEEMVSEMSHCSVLCKIQGHGFSMLKQILVAKHGGTVTKNASVSAAVLGWAQWYF